MNWISPAIPRWLSLAAAGFIVAFSRITRSRTGKSVAGGALAVIALLAVGMAIAAVTMREYEPAGGRSASGDSRTPATANTASPPATASAALPVLSCLDELAGDVVLAACEKAVFASAESTAAAVSYVASQITRLTSLADLSSERMTPDLKGLRRSIERDRYGLVAHVLQERDRCTPTECAVFRSLTNNHQIITNMNDHVYDGLVSRYSAIWNTPNHAMRALAAYPPSAPTGKPTNAEFPSAASTPAVSIMLPEPGTGKAAAARGAAASPLASASAPASQNPAVAAAKKPPPKPSHPSPAAPMQISPAPSASAAVQ